MNADLRLWPRGDCVMGILIRTCDWSCTPLGPIETWPQSLKTAVDICLDLFQPACVWWGPQLTQIYNDAGIAFLRERHPMALGASARAFFAENNPALGRVAEQVLVTGKPARAENIGLKTGRPEIDNTVVVAMSLSAVRDEGGRVAGLLATAVETIDQMGASERLRESEERFRAFMDNGPMIAWAKDEAGRHVYLNTPFERQFGVRLEDWYGKTDFELWPNDIAKKFRINDMAVLDADQVISVIEETQTDGVGQSRQWQSFKFPFRDTVGRRYVGGIGIDITESKLAEERLRENEERLRLALDASLAGVWSWDATTNAPAWDERYEALYGFAPTDPISFETWFERIHPDDRPRVKAHIEHILATPGEYAWREEFRVLHPMLGQRWIVGTGMAKRDSSGRCVRIAGISIDITDRKEVEARLRASEEKLTEVNADLERRVLERTHQLETEMNLHAETQAALAQSQRLEALGQLTGGIAHDFNNLLTIILGSLEQAEPLIENQIARRSIRRAVSAAETGVSFNRRLLAFARNRRLERLRFNLNERVTDVTSLLQPMLGDKVTLSMRMADDLWMVQTDPSEIDNAILNLAINARDAMKEGGTLAIETCNVTLDRAATARWPEALPGDYVLLRISDTGHGMTPEVLRRAIEPFFTTKETGKGTGLGLSGVYGFARQSGGFLSLASEVGKGATVDLYLPRGAVIEADAGKDLVQPEAPTGDGEVVLVVEDDDQVREVTLDRLESLGYTVLAAQSGREAIDLMGAEKSIALVFSDVVMAGGMTGYDVARWTRTYRPGVKVLLASGYNEVQAKATEEMTWVKVLAKPYSRVQLGRSIREVLDES
jgi:PAS domain S-box-containing protein